MENQELNERQIIESYFWDGFRYDTIVKFLQEYHGIKISCRTMKRRLQDYSLSRRLHPSNPVDVWNAVRTELQGPGRLGGYRAMRHLLIRKYHLRASNEIVRCVLRQMDPVGVEARRCHRLHRRTYSSRGPNHTWHIDGYDKLRPYGILINGCIDGYSRKVLWLKCCYTNHHPGVVAGYFVDCVGHAGGYPLQTRTDCGTENVTIAAIQCLVSGNVHSHIYGTSPGNQRIEAWWSFYRRQHSQWWIELFEMLIEYGAYHPGHIQETECLRFCFMAHIQKELDRVREQWNTHRIRPSAGARCPPGIPDELYHLPHRPASNQLIVVEDTLPAEILSQVEVARACEDKQCEDYFQYLCRFHSWNMPEDTDSALELYLTILPFLQ